MQLTRRERPLEATPYGYELILDLHSCDPATFNRSSIDNYFTELCKGINMTKCVVHFWDDLDLSVEDHDVLPHAKGTSAVCFILTSSVVVHTLDILRAVYINIFSCKPFDNDAAQRFSQQWFVGDVRKSTFVARE